MSEKNGKYKGAEKDREAQVSPENAVVRIRTRCPSRGKNGLAGTGLEGLKNQREGMKGEHRCRKNIKNTQRRIEMI